MNINGSRLTLCTLTLQKKKKWIFTPTPNPRIKVVNLHLKYKGELLYFYILILPPLSSHTPFNKLPCLVSLGAASFLTGPFQKYVSPVFLTAFVQFVSWCKCFISLDFTFIFIYLFIFGIANLSRHRLAILKTEHSKPYLVCPHMKQTLRLGFFFFKVTQFTANKPRD